LTPSEFFDATFIENENKSLFNEGERAGDYVNKLFELSFGLSEILIESLNRVIYSKDQKQSKWKDTFSDPG
jgi:hypothetical protein